ncbi:response regulator [bacterium]|nr:response regulator [bacterium]
MNFVLIDDNILHMNKVKSIINEFMFSKEEDYVINEFLDITNELIKYIEDNESEKIFIIDFELPSCNGIDIARLIRKNDWTSIIIFLSVHSRFAYKSFKQRLQILDFVDKMDNPEKEIQELLNICIKKKILSKKLIFKSGGISVKLDIQQIICIYRTKERKSVIVTKTGIYKTYLSLKKLDNNLNHVLTQTHRACYVNIINVESINWKNKLITFKNGFKLELISLKYKELLNHDF